MIGFIIWLIGAICCIWCIMDVFKKKKLGIIGKLIISILLLCCSWLGLIIYYFFLRNAIK